MPARFLIDQRMEKTRYSDSELESFKVVIEDKLKIANDQLEFYLKQMADMADNPDAKIRGLDDGTGTAENERILGLAARQRKHIQHLENAHATIRAVLEKLTVGEVHPPFRVDNWVLLVQMEHRQPASLTDAIRLQLYNELFQKDLEATLDQQLQAIYPTLLPQDPQLVQPPVA